MITCPGCGGRNEPEAKLCEWCGRPFVAQPRQIPVALLALAALGLLAITLVVGVLVLVLSLLGSQGAPAQAPVEGSPPAQVSPTGEPSERRTPAIEPTVTAEFVRIANTGGVGAFIRQEPQPNARGIVAYPERTVLRIVGPDTVVNGGVWRSVEDRRGVRGWMSSEYLVPSDTGF